MVAPRKRKVSLMKNLIFSAIIGLFVLTRLVVSANEHYGSTIPAVPPGGELFRAEVIDCRPQDYDNEDPYFFVAMGSIWEDEGLYSLVFYSNYTIEEGGLTNPDALIYGDGTYEGNITIFIRVGDHIERFTSWQKFVDKYEKSICSIPVEEI